MSKLVIVESPAKAKTIEKYLPKGYKVRASMGHVRDLPDNAGQLPAKFKNEEWASLGVNVDKDFDAIYVVKDPRSKKSLSELKKMLKDADELLLATDEDREGEAISWHLLEALKPKVPVRRMVFNEITKTAINEALSNTRELDQSLVEAQETRRILDRLVGYPLSLLVAKKIKHGLSAGRVQSPAVYLLVERERERRRFRQGTYWDIKAKLERDGSHFDADLVQVDGTRVASGKDFDESTGRIAEGKNVLLLEGERAKRLVEGLKGKPLTVVDVNEREYSTSPKPPFTTSTLQQEASRKLNLGARDTMSIAQRLYESGFITYMRTDSTNLSQQALDGARNAIKELYGDSYLPSKPRSYKGKKAKGAQEAHEAIRPTGDSFTHPDKAGLRGREKALYDLIWKRTVACQMANARKTGIRVDFEVEVDGQKLGFRSNGTRIDFPGFLRAYVEGSDDPEAVLEDQERLLPKMAKDDDVPVESVDPIEHQTKPPARYTEASLVRKLEEEGIGRPSTYATIIQKISDGRYAKKQGRTLVPTYMAFAVAGFLENYFPELVDLKFTARMEDDLDSIASGSGSKVKYLHEFYRQEGAFRDQVDTGDSSIEPIIVREVPLEDLDATLRVGRYGAYAEVDVDGEKKTVNIPDTIPPADLTNEMVAELLAEREKGPESLGEDPETGMPVLLMNGRYGHYLQLGERSDENKKPKTASVPKGVEPEELTLDQALQCLSLPRNLGKHPEDGKKIEAGVGRYGPFVRHNKEYRNIPDDKDVFTISLEAAVELLKQPKGRRGSKKVLKEIGKHPETGEEMNLLDGRYGPYIKAGKTNASLPKGMKPEEVTLEKAVELVDAKRA